MPKIDYGVGVDFDTFESRSSLIFCFTINLNLLYIYCVTKWAAGTAFKYVKIDTNGIANFWQQSSYVDMRKCM